MIGSDGPPQEEHGTPTLGHGARHRSSVTEPKQRQPCERKQTSGSKVPSNARLSSAVSVFTIFRRQLKQTVRRAKAGSCPRRRPTSASKRYAAWGGQPGM